MTAAEGSSGVAALSGTPRSAMIVGASGLIGRELLRQMRSDERYGDIHVLTRRPLSIGDGVQQHVIKYQDLPAIDIGIEAIDDVYCALGTTIAKAGSKSNFARVDRDYVVAVGILAQRLGAKRFLVVSSLGADPGSSQFYLRTKGEMESAVRDLGLPSVHVFRPSLLAGDRDEFRLGERAGGVLLRLFSPLVPERYRPVEDNVLAAAMTRAAVEEAGPFEIYESDEIRRLVT